LCAIASIVFRSEETGMAASVRCDADKNTLLRTLQDNQIVAVDDLIEGLLTDPLCNVNRFASRNLLRFLRGIVDKPARDRLFPLVLDVHHGADVKGTRNLPHACGQEALAVLDNGACGPVVDDERAAGLAGERDPAVA